MRLDKYLVVARLVKQRTRSKQLCDGGHVKVAGKTAKAAHEVRIDEELEVTLPQRRIVLRVLATPEVKSVPKAEAANLYEVISEETIGSYRESTDPEDY